MLLQSNDEDVDDRASERDKWTFRQAPQPQMTSPIKIIRFLCIFEVIYYYGSIHVCVCVCSIYASSIESYVLEKVIVFEPLHILCRLGRLHLACSVVMNFFYKDILFTHIDSPFIHTYYFTSNEISEFRCYTPMKCAVVTQFNFTPGNVPISMEIGRILQLLVRMWSNFNLRIISRLPRPFGH